MLTSLDIIKILLNKTGVESKDGYEITFELLDLESVPALKSGVGASTNKTLCFEIGTIGYCLKCRRADSNTLVFDVEDAPIPNEQLDKMANKLQLLFNERVLVISNTYTSKPPKIGEITEEDRELLDSVTAIGSKYSFSYTR